MQAISKELLFRPGIVVRAFKSTSATSGQMEIGHITSYVRNEAGIPCGLVIAFDDGMCEQYDFTCIDIIDTQKSLVTHFVPWGRR